MTMNEMLENVLSGEFGLNVEEIKEGDSDEAWYRFEIDGLKLQGGDYGDHLRLSVDMDEIDYDHDFEKIAREMNAINENAPPGIVLKAEDNYFTVFTTLPEEIISEKFLSKTLKQMCEFAKSDSVRSTVATFRAW